MSCHRYENLHSRREFLEKTGLGLGAGALAHLLGGCASASTAGDPHINGLPGLPHFAPKAKRVICLFQSGGPSHLDLLDPKPELDRQFDKDLPDSIRRGQRITGMVASQARLACQPSRFKFTRHGKCGTEVSELLPHIGGIADEICVLRSVHTEAINHDPAITFFQTGSQLPGRPSMGAWTDYGLGRMNDNLPSFVVLVSTNKDRSGQGLLARLWGSGFLPSNHQGVGLRPGANPVLYLQNPPTVDGAQRRELLDDLATLNEERARELGDPETITRIKAYEMAYRMQTSVPELADISQESKATLAAYGPEVTRPGSYAANCLLARRLLERDVRFVQLFHRGWDQHVALSRQLPNQCRDIDQPTAALIKDLKTRGLLEDTLVIFATEFGRTAFTQGGFGNPASGRDHHGRCFSVFLAGGGIKPGFEYGATDDFAYNIAKDGVHLRDLHATILHCLGIDHARFTYKFRGLNVKLTGVEEAHVVKGVLA